MRPSLTKLICPVCNGLTKITTKCHCCQGLMIDQGMLMNYLGPYSPYGSADEPDQSDCSCQHILACDHCHVCQVTSVPLISASLAQTSDEIGKSQ